MPKINFIGPVPMIFEGKQLDLILQCIAGSKKSACESSTAYELVYIGFRP
jgi:hypothetical protein